MKRLLCVALATTMALTLLAGCQKKEEKKGDEVKEIKIGYAINNLNDTFQTYVHGAAEEAAKAAGYKMSTSDAQEDVVKQQDQVNTFITQKVSAIIVVPVDTSAMDPITKAATEAKIPLIFVNRNPYADKELPEGVYYVGSQEIVAGTLQAEEAGKLLNGKGGVGILMGILGNEGALKRTEGVENTIKEKFPDMKILAKEAGDWQPDKGMNITENWLTAHGKNLNAILANNDEMALGAIKALEAAGRTDVIVMGVDAIDTAKQAVDEGKMTATVLQDSKGQGGGAVNIIKSVLDGQKVEPITWIPFVLINKDNIADFK